jgi:hypothetical protein
MGKIKSFSSLVKDELTREIPKKDCCKKAELYASIKIYGHVAEKKEKEENKKEDKEKKSFEVKINTENASVAIRTMKLIRDLFSHKISAYTEVKSYKNKGKRYSIIIPIQERIIEFLKVLKILDYNFKIRDRISSDLIKKKCCKISFLRSCFYNSGYISNPKSGYHLEFVIKNKEDAKKISKILNKFSFNSKIYKRRKFFNIYLKRSEDIFNFLKLIGAHSTVLDLENTKVIKEIKSYVERIVNFESANLKRTIEASQKQINNIEKIENFVGIDLLPEALKEIAYIRLEYPEASLSELGKLSWKKLSKSGVNNRLRRINKIAKSL